MENLIKKIIDTINNDHKYINNISLIRNVLVPIYKSTSDLENLIQKLNNFEVTVCETNIDIDDINLFKHMLNYIIYKINVYETDNFIDTLNVISQTPKVYTTKIETYANIVANKDRLFCWSNFFRGLGDTSFSGISNIFGSREFITKLKGHPYISKYFNMPPKETYNSLASKAGILDFFDWKKDIQNKFNVLAILNTKDYNNFEYFYITVNPKFLGYFWYDDIILDSIAKKDFKSYTIKFHYNSCYHINTKYHTAHDSNVPVIYRLNVNELDFEGRNNERSE